ncbi:NADH-quinone oxidoreductase subunit J [Thermosynechococcus vestitus]|uniref:NADH-quinone oxidoreductase subunit J n=1 Tax=Thermosynechococcus vestitus (strain NIES-2133 / IAM M-273 / BP-1) TaxID=197221 RepID=Q8DL30_THEVB|nr:NADH-quinone oxidoreductase subunit J [Thermosynechococcus vestitus]6HUM_G Chain G, NADH dehydrogenase subunit 6 [Thermosynechococcus vestitus BP-1]6KHI_G Chain G, NADH-quinone oxidoreductase subunit J [Thermosynechococcus vestitus BP-1]6KHJ_G Chain G, NADH-quinone oxidoreductase subunit J [Thermosynechococcus vestitus BP-1]6L7O_G Chain G, NADH-quinone oxidoreductase subunit J [Thermosynechococcus vestitus BP-1]6L7P_G Chain G, NADH-quinone oxidoreductase subunit J [Thermosynechococcus vesti
MDLATLTQTITFFALAAAVIIAALGVVLLDNVVYSAFLLGGVFLSIAGLYILMNADFVSAAQILIYVGAVNVLILFAIMLVNKRETYTPVPGRWLRQGGAAVVSLGVFALLTKMILQTPWQLSSVPPTPDSITTIGQHFFSDFLLPFELASVLLLMALIGAVVLARRELVLEPEPILGEEVVPPLELPERPREPVALSEK